MFLRKEIAKAVKLTSVQVKKFTDLASATEVAQKKLGELAMKGGDTSAATEAVAEATSAEQKALNAVLTPDQIKELKGLVGPIFDTKQLKRIYPMAPEFAPDTEWFNSSPLTLESLRGKVVVVHFYAFQCHNCHANFEIYRRWHEKYAEQGVVVVGIQSPETQTERDPNSVREAAKDRKLEFPIIMDRDKKNWDRWANTLWPTVYVIDKRGYLRHWWQGSSTGKERRQTKPLRQSLKPHWPSRCSSSRSRSGHRLDELPPCEPKSWRLRLRGFATSATDGASRIKTLR